MSDIGHESPGRGVKKSKMNKKLAPIQADIGTTGQLRDSAKSVESRRELMLQVKRLNPAGVSVAPNIFWDVEGNLKTTTIDTSDVDQQLTIVENGVNYSVNRFNNLKIGNDRLVDTLKNKLDTLDAQKRAYDRLDAMKNAETEEGLRIEAIEREVESCIEEIDKKQHYTRQLQFMLERLKRNQLKFDAHMTGMEDTLTTLTKECGEIVLLRKGLDAGLAKATNVHEETMLRLANAKKTRQVLLEQRRGEIKAAKSLQVWLSKREDAKEALALELRGDLSIEEENFLKNQISEKVEKTKKLQRASEESHKKLQSMEDAYTKIKQVTGVSSIDEMHEKFSNQKNNKRNLEFEVQDAEARLVAVKKANSKQDRAFEELKASGGGMAEMTREAINQLEAAISHAKNDLKVTLATSERLSIILLGLNQGSIGLLQRVKPYLNLADGGVFDLTQADDNLPWAETLDALNNAEQVLSKMHESLNGDNGNSPSHTPSGNGGSYDDEAGSDNEYDGHIEVPPYSNNIRVKSRKIRLDVDFNRNEDDTGFEKGGDQITKLPYLPTATASNDHGTTTDKGVAEGGGKITLPSFGSEGAKKSEIPSRSDVKHVSKKVSREALKKEEMTIRRKILAEKMLSASAGQPDDSALELAARLKSQNEMAARLCTVHKTPTLPEGVTRRDDAMTKSAAFLTKMPDLV